MFSKKLLKKSIAVTLSVAMTLGMANWGIVIGTPAGAVTVKADETKVDETKFDADKHVMVKEVTEPTSIAASSSQSFGISVPANETYWAQMNVKAEGDMYINLRGTNSRLYLGSTQCGVIVAEGFGTGKWPQRSTDLKNGVTVTVKSSATSVSLWIDGEVVVDNHTFNDVNTVGDFNISWTIGATTVNSLKVWTLSSEPKFSATEHKEVASLSNTTTAASTSKNFGITIPADVSYWATYDVKTSGQIYFGVRGSEQSRMFVEGKQFGILGMFEKDIWTGHTLDTQAGYRLTIYSTPDKFSAWINGKKITDGLDVTKNKGLVGVPGLGWCTAETTITNAKVWIDKNAKLTDAPEYDAETNTLLKSIDSQTLEKEKAFDLGFKVPAYQDYYMTATIKAAGGLYTSFRGDENKLYMDANQYYIAGDGKNDWVQKKTNLAEGAKIAIKSTPKSVSIWLNGEKIADNLALEDAKTEGAYVITWPTAETTITDVKVWTGKETFSSKFDWAEDYSTATATITNEATKEAYTFDATISSKETTPATCDNAGVMEYTATYGKFSDVKTKDIEKLEHKYSAKFDWAKDYKSATVTITCANDASHTRTENAKVTSKEITPATCEEKGTIRYTATCGDYSDYKDVDIEPLGHKDSAKFDWAEDYQSATVTITCANDASHTRIEDAKVTSEVTKPATCEEKGTIRYTATCGDYSDYKDVDIDALGHKYTGKYVWAKDYKSAKLTLTCANDSNHVLTYDIKSTAKVTTKATYFAKGVTTYTVSFGEFTETKKVTNIAKLTLGKTKSVTAKSTKAKQIKVSLKKVTGAKKYEIQYSTNMKFKKAKSVTTGKTNYTIKKLSSKKKYYVRVRAFVTSGKAKVTGSWVKAKKAVKVK